MQFCVIWFNLVEPRAIYAAITLSNVSMIITNANGIKTIAALISTTVITDVAIMTDRMKTAILICITVIIVISYGTD